MSTHTVDPSQADTTPTPWVRVPVLALGLSLVVGVILLAFSWPAVTAAPSDLPIGIVGPDAQVAQVSDAIDEQTDGAILLEHYGDRDAAVAAIEQRDVYGAVVLGDAPGTAPEVLTASAASSAVAQMLTGIADQLQAQIDAQIRASLEQGAGGQGFPVVTVEVTDVVPFADDDPNGAGLAVAMFPMVLGGILGGVALAMLVRGGIRRIVGVLVYASAAGLVLAGILQGLYGALQGSFAVNAAAIALAIAAIAATITGLAGLLGAPGAAIGAATMILVGNPLSAATVPVEFLLSPWGAIGQWLPPGAAATLLRDLSYFPDADAGQAWFVLAVWATLGLALTLVDLPGRRLRNRATVDA